MLKPKPNQEIKVDKTKRQEEIENQLKITLKPPTLLHNREPLPTPTTVEPNKNQPSEGLETHTTDNTTKPKEDKPVNTLQQLMNKAMPETKTKPLKTPRQQKKPKPKVVEPSELKLFLEQKKRERKMKTKGKSVVSVKIVTVEIFFEPEPSPRNQSVSATLPQTNTSPTPSTPRANNYASTEASRTFHQNTRGPESSASNEGYQK